MDPLYKKIPLFERGNQQPINKKSFGKPQTNIHLRKHFSESLNNHGVLDK